MLPLKAKNVKTAFSEGNKSYRNGDIKDAIEKYLEAINENPSFYHYYTNLSHALIKMCESDDVEKANACLKRIAYSGKKPFSKKDYIAVSKSKLVNGKWYLSEYASWLHKSIDPILHYLTIGWRLGFNPCNRFDTDFYLNEYKHEIEDDQAPLLHYLQSGKNKRYQIKGQQRSMTADLAVQLWSGHSDSAVKALEEISNDKTVANGHRWQALWQIARWEHFLGNYIDSLKLAKEMDVLQPNRKDSKEWVYLTYYGLLANDQRTGAQQHIKEYLKRNPKDADAQLALANSLSNDNERIETINAAFAQHGFVGIACKDATKPLNISNILGESPEKIEGDLKVSIVMPIYSAGEQVRIAIESLLAQSYRNIEIIAVDDCSPDNTFSILQALEQQDPRVKAVQPQENGGAYAARNYGLKFATGDVITTHDSDDWSHPQKIASQVEYLEKNPNVQGCAVHWIRVLDNLEFTQNWRPTNSLTHWSQSSFMFRRNVLETIGEWDHVRIGGDTEYIWRMQAKFGKGSLAKILPEIPLAFALDEESSLTRTKATHVRTVYFGLRHIYREICAWWHNSDHELHVQNAKLSRRFPAPRSMYERTEEALNFDQVIAGDFSRIEDCKLAANKISNIPQGSRTALFHWPSFNKSPEPLCHLYFEMLDAGKVEPIVMGQCVQSESFFICDKNLLMHPLDGFPDFKNFKDWSLT